MHEALREHLCLEIGFCLLQRPMDAGEPKVHTVMLGIGDAPINHLLSHATMLPGGATTLYLMLHLYRRRL